MRVIISALMMLFLSACANGYKEFYEANPNLQVSTLDLRRVNPPPERPLVGYVHPSNAQEAIDSASRKGYVIIGESSFTSGHAPTEEQAIQQAREVKADSIMILSPTHAETINSVMPITTPTTTTTYSSGSATAYGKNGPVTAYGSGTTTSYGTQTTYVPYQIDRSNYGALFFVKVKYPLGIRSRNLEDEERRAIQSNKGAVVIHSVEGTPAYQADILPGDIIMEIDGERIINNEHMSKVVESKAGNKIAINLVRDGKTITKEVQLIQY